MTTALLTEIMQLVVIPLLGILTAYLVKLIETKINDISKHHNNDLETKYLNMLSSTVTDCVMATTQTYVESLKKQGCFDVEAQKEAFNQTYTAIINILSDDAKQYLTEIVGDLQLYITQKIEAEVNKNKTNN